MTKGLNQRALRIADEIASRADDLRVEVHSAANGTRIIDCGAKMLGGLEAGVMLAEICLAGLGRVSLVPCRKELWSGPAVTVLTDQPVAACMASQYAGWQIAGEKFFAMGSGPMRAAGSREPLFDEIGHREKPEHAVGVLETHKLPLPDVCDKIASACGVSSDKLTLLVASTASFAGTIQVVARSVETALHKMHTVGFDLRNVVSGFGTAPLPPVASDNLVGIGRTNDAVLYGGEVTIWLRELDETESASGGRQSPGDVKHPTIPFDDEDARIAALGPKVPSSSSADYGEPFATIFERYNRDFYKIDPLLFSPASVTLVNLSTGRSFHFGDTNAEVLRQSFGES